ncbi:unnamed protein product [Peronospora belbahrii]|uniref:Uncharacterized protein n=1 Tax=Peronospora belbahrii TaxID=622444 RepID=A0ABN8CZV9_9STRA|nr:unnamed protein product [Peronospora belbahrii]
MTSRTDLEARLQALRNPKRPAISPAPPPSLYTSARTNCISRGSLPVFIAVQDLSTCFPTSVAPSRALEASRGHDEVLQLTAGQLLGPEYEKAVKVAQYAMETERRQMPHTAIDAYIQAGQMLIEIGRRQAAPHLQDIVKAKALTLLERAEGLSEWTNDVLAKDSSQQALAVAYQQSQQHCNKFLTDKQELVFKMQQDNRHLKERLNQLALLTKIRGRMVKVIRTRRARKAAQAKEKVEMEMETAARATHDIMSSRRGLNEVTGDVFDYLYEDREDSHGEPNDVTGSSSEENEEPGEDYQQYQTHPASATGRSPRDVQKVGLINELHERIGLPKIDQFRNFEPLTNDPTTDKKQEQLQSELELAKQEAEKLRAAVHEMERCLQLAAEHSQQRSIKLEQEKRQEFAAVQSELDRLRDELEAERRHSTSLHSSSLSGRFRSLRSSFCSHRSVASDPGSGEMKDNGVMDQLRSSFHKVFPGQTEESDGRENVCPDRSALIEHSTYSQYSPRHTRKSSFSTSEAYDVDEVEIEEDEDGGVWL